MHFKLFCLLVLLIHLNCVFSKTCVRPNEALTEDLCEGSCDVRRKKKCDSKNWFFPQGKNCKCKPGYSRDQTYTCMETDLCEKRRYTRECGDNEEWVCSAVCSNNECNFFGPCSRSCIKGCYCKKNHKRNSEGTCIKAKDCFVGKKKFSPFIEG